MASQNSIGNRVADNTLQIFNRTADTSSNSVDLIKNRAGGAITSGDQLGSVIFYGNDGSTNIIGARILAGSSGTIAANRVAGNLYFYTHPDSTSAAAIRMTIPSTGGVTIAAPDSGQALTATINTNDYNSYFYNSFAGTTASAIALAKSRTGGAITSGDVLGTVSFQGHTGSAYLQSGAIEVVSSGTIAASRIASTMNFYTHPDSTTAASVRMAIASTGTVTINPQDATGNDLLVQGAKSGLSMGIICNNTSNTASADATLNVQVAGGTAYDPRVTFAVSGVTGWSCGIDNSDSDAFKISAQTVLETNNYMRIATTGEINYPLQSSFLAYNAGDDANVTGDGTSYTIACDTEVYDQNGDYDNTTFTFTAPVTGRYIFTASSSIGALTASFTTGIWQINASNRAVTVGRLNVGAARDAGNIYSQVGATVVDMDAADTCTWITVISGSTKTLTSRGAASSSGTTFGGQLIA